MSLIRSVFLSTWLLAGAAQAQDSDALAVAIASNDAAKAQAALTAGADVNANLGEGRTPLITAVMMTKPDMVRFLLSQGADPNRAADDGAIGNALSAAFFASPGMAIARRADEDFMKERRGPALECLRLVAAARPNFDVLVSRGPTRLSPLMIAAEAGVPDAVKILLDAGASPDFANGGKYTALDYAVDRAPRFAEIPESDRAEVVRMLLAAGARKNRKGADGLSPLDRARKAGSQWAVEALTR
jgi:ankyrin repeat protein